MLRQFILLLALASFITPAYSQTTTYKYWVGFTDKKESPFSIERPKEFLSVNALNRRGKLNIAINDTDLPVNPLYIMKVVDIPGVELRNQSKWLNGVTVHVTDTSTIRSLREMPFVRQVKLVGMEKSLPTLVLHPDSPIPPKTEPPLARFEPLPFPVEEQFGKNYFGKAFAPIAMCNGDRMQKMGYIGTGVRELTSHWVSYSHRTSAAPFDLASNVGFQMLRSRKPYANPGAPN